MSMQQLLRSWTLSSYLNTKPPSPVITLSTNSTVGYALNQLATHNITSAPVFARGTKTYYGFFDLNDVLTALLTLVNVRELTEENRVFKIRTAGLQLEHYALQDLLLVQDGALIYKADVSSSLMEVILHGFLEPAGRGEAAVVHRVGVFEEADDVEEEEPMAVDGEEPQGIRGVRVTHVISQSDMLRFVLKRLEQEQVSWPLVDSTLEQLGMAYKPVVCVPAEMSTINAFATMAANQVSCVGVVSHSQGGALAASLSSSDLRGLLPQQFSALATPVLQFLNAKAANGVWPQQGQQSPGGSASAWGLKGAEPLKAVKVITCSPTAPLRQALRLMVEEHAHQLFVVDARHRPAGILTITDMLRKLTGWQPSSAAIEIPDLDEEEVEQWKADSGHDMGVESGEELVEMKRVVSAVGAFPPAGSS